MLPFAIQFKNFLKCVCLSLCKVNSKEICEEISFPSFFRQTLMPAILLRFKANYLEKMHSYRYFSWWIPIALTKIYFFRMVLTWCKNLCIQQAPSLSHSLLFNYMYELKFFMSKQSTRQSRGDYHSQKMRTSLEVLYVAWQEQQICFPMRKKCFFLCTCKTFYYSYHATWLPCKTSIPFCRHSQD